MMRHFLNASPRLACVSVHMGRVPLPSSASVQRSATMTSINNSVHRTSSMVQNAAVTFYAMRFCSSSSSTASDDSSTASSSSRQEPRSEYPIIQLPARTLLTKQSDLNIRHLKNGEFDEMIQKVIKTRKYYQYPSLSAPQIGWNVRMFTLFDDSVWINPTIVDVNVHCGQGNEYLCNTTMEVGSGATSSTQEDAADVIEEDVEVKNCWAWEPCASCAFMMHYIERPSTCRIRAYDAKGNVVEVVLSRMAARCALHEMDHLDGVLFTRRIPDTNHVVLIDGFSTMSDWSDDYPSLEARSTNLYTTFTPPYRFQADPIADANLLDRKFDDRIYPGWEQDRALREVENRMANEDADLKRALWLQSKQKEKQAPPPEVDEEVCDDDDDSSDADPLKKEK